ncbi:MAG: dihydropteroate synthase [Acidobacteriota bacterium]
MPWGERTLLMGVVNVTPDSFSDGGRYFEHGDASARAERLLEEGADIIDLGGESTRPGAAAVAEEEERRRVVPVIERLSARFPVPISIDTTKSGVARAALDSGACIVNDVSGLRLDREIAPVAARAGAAVVLGHMRGEPRTMQASPSYGDAQAEVRSELCDSVRRALDAGIAAGAIAIDPGLGFGKRFEDNLALIRGLPDLAALGFPVLVGISRKSFTGRLSGLPPSERLPASIAAAALAVAWGASIVRVHDVAATRQAMMLVDALVAARQDGR